MITVYVKRFNKETDEEPHIESYEIEEYPGMKVLDALEEINRKYDADISFRSSCLAGQCGSCGVKINGNGALACKAEIKDNRLIEPLDFPVIKDLIVDRSSADEKIKQLQLSLDCDSETSHEKIKPEDIKDTKKVRSCIECYTCLSTCPVVKHFKEDFLGPYYLRYISKFDFDPRDEYDRLIEALDSGMYACTSCGKCGSICPKNINSFGDAIEKRRAMAYARDLGPLDAHKVFKDNVVASGRSVSKPEEPFIETIHKKWDEEGKYYIDEDENKEKVALFTGCMVDYRAQDVGYALIDVLKDVVQDLVDKNKEVFKDYDKVITICAGCGATLKNDHPKYGSNLNVQDISEFLVDKLDASKMKEVNTKVTWHDPCHLSRGQGIREEPRKIIEMIPGVEFEELELPNQCCGAGGGIKSGKPEIALGLAKDKAEMVKATGADYVTTICPFCQINIQDGLNEIGLENVKILNLIQLLKMAYDE